MVITNSMEEWSVQFKEIAQDYRIFGPIRQSNKGAFSDTDLIAYGEVLTVEDIVWSEKSFFSPKEVFYPIRETLFRFVDGEANVPPINTKPILLLLRPCDLNGIDRLDAIFLRNGLEEDYYYSRRRELLKFAIMACETGFDSCFCASMGSADVHENYEIALWPTIDGMKIQVASEDFQSYFNTTKDSLIESFPLAPIENITKVTIPNFEGIPLEAIFNHPIWLEYTRRCIACGRCNTSCITCSCFTMQDVFTDDSQTTAERRRRWAGCHVKGYSDMAGGHTFRPQNGERMRFKLMHKVYDFHKRFNKHMCVGCGRCDDVCPEYISFPAAIEKVNRIIEEMRQDDN